MHSELNPYEPTPLQAPPLSCWDRSVLIQAAFGLQFLILFGVIIMTVNGAQSSANAVIEVDPVAHDVLGSIVLLAFVILCVATFTKSDWPLHLRCCIIGIDVLVLAVLMFVALGFGSL